MFGILSSHHPITTSQKGSKIGTLSTPIPHLYRDEVLNCNIGSVFLFWSRSKKGCQMSIIIHHADFSESLKTKIWPPLSSGVTPILLRKAQSCWYLTSNQLRSPWPKIHWKLTENCFKLFRGPQTVWGRQTPHTNIQQYAVGVTYLTYLQPPACERWFNPASWSKSCRAWRVSSASDSSFVDGSPTKHGLTGLAPGSGGVDGGWWWWFTDSFRICEKTDSLRKHVGNKERMKKNTYVTYVLFTLTRFECEFGLQYWSHSFGCGKYSRISKVCIIHCWLYWLPAYKSFFLEGCLS